MWPSSPADSLEFLLLKANRFLFGVEWVHLIGGACSMCPCLSVEEKWESKQVRFSFFPSSHFGGRTRIALIT